MALVKIDPYRHCAKCYRLHVAYSRFDDGSRLVDDNLTLLLERHHVVAMLQRDHALRIVSGGFLGVLLVPVMDASLPKLLAERRSPWGCWKFP